MPRLKIRSEIMENNEEVELPPKEEYQEEKEKEEKEEKEMYNEACRDAPRTAEWLYPYKIFKKLISELLYDNKEDKDNLERLNDDDLQKLYKDSYKHCVEYIKNDEEYIKGCTTNWDNLIKRVFEYYNNKHKLKDKIDELFKKEGIIKKNFITRKWKDRSTGEKIGFVLMNIGLGIITAGIFNAILFGVVRNDSACCSKEAINAIEEDEKSIK